MITSVVPGQTLNATLVLPKAAVGQVRWMIRGYQGKLIAQGLAAPTGITVVISTVIPSSAIIPPDKSKYVISATDGVTATSEWFSVVAPTDPIQNDHGVEVSYVQGRVFKDSLVLPFLPASLTISVGLTAGASVLNETTVPVASESDYTRIGDSYVFTYTGGIINTNTAATYGTAMVTWFITDADGNETMDMHPLYTITSRTMVFMNAIRKIVDKIRLGDVHQYLQITTTDLIHATLRGADYVGQAPPLASYFALDGLPIPLMDFIVKAGAIDILQAQYLAEGMGSFDFQGLGVQLNVDRTQYLDNLINQLKGDLDRLTDAKKKWLEMGKPIGPEVSSGKRPIGTLGLTTGVYSNQPRVANPYVFSGGNAYNFVRYFSY